MPELMGWCFVKLELKWWTFYLKAILALSLKILNSFLLSSHTFLDIYNRINFFLGKHLVCCDDGEL